MNKRITAKERGLIKGAIRRVFSRSDLRRLIISTALIEHSDPARPRVKKWSRCTECLTPTPTYQIELDHQDPVIPLDKALEDMTWDEIIDRIWCAESNLKPLCKSCHLHKSKQEAKLRRENKKRRTNVGRKAVKRPSKDSSQRTSTRSSKSRTIHGTQKARRFKTK